MLLGFLPLIVAQGGGMADAVVNVEDFRLEVIQQDYSIPQKNKSVDKKPLSIGKQSFQRGIGTHANSLFAIDLAGVCKKFYAKVGVDSEVGTNGSVQFQIWVDGKKAAESPVLRGGDEPVDLAVDFAPKAKQMLLVVTEAGDGIDYDHADWAEPTLIVRGPDRKKPKAVVWETDPPMVAHLVPKKPQIHGPRIVGCSVGKPFVFRVPVTGEGNLTFAARGLPAGLVLNPYTGVITGTPAEEGRFPVQIVVTGRGVDIRKLIIDTHGKLALTPPMGWNSWNVWGTSVTADKVRAAAQFMAKTGLADFGYRYINIDDAWEGERDQSGEIMLNKKFGDMKQLADDVHSLGLLLGIYSSPGPKTCGGYEGSYQHEVQDANTYANWGIDYLKYDWCSYNDVAPDHSLPELQKPYLIMRDALRGTTRDIVYSLCQYGMGDVYKWGNDVGGNLWRTTGDITDTWGSMASIGFSHSERSPFAGPGGWNDPDMLVVGNLGWGEKPRPTRLKPNEQVTHITLWALLAAPLIVGCDLSTLDNFTKDLLTNHDVIEVDQDPLGQAATRRWKDGDLEIWARPLFDGTLAVGMFNRGYVRAQIPLKWETIGLSGTQPIRNLWIQSDLKPLADGITLTVPAHGAMLLKVGTPQPNEFTTDQG